MSGIEPIGSAREPGETKKFCPLLQADCRTDCALFMESEEARIRKCAFYVIANQLDILAKEKGFGI